MGKGMDVKLKLKNYCVVSLIFILFILSSCSHHKNEPLLQGNTHKSTSQLISNLDESWTILPLELEKRLFKIELENKTGFGKKEIFTDAVSLIDETTNKSNYLELYEVQHLSNQIKKFIGKL
jgi:hypothetical protein